ncbi:MAG: hypothetical protein RH860_09050 [Cytophagales bacterium]
MIKTKNRHYLLLFLSFLIPFLYSCKDDDDTAPLEENAVPQILISGPEYDTINPIEAPIEELWVIATDADGAEDIAAVILNISEINLEELIVRPDDSTEICRLPYYSDNDTINIFPYLNKTSFSIVNQPLIRTISNRYYFQLYYQVLCDGGFLKQHNSFGDWVKSCTNSDTYKYSIEQFGLYPPLIDDARDVFVTYAKFSVKGIRIDVFDHSGSSSSKNFPDLSCYFSNSMEDQTLP